MRCASSAVGRALARLPGHLGGQRRAQLPAQRAVQAGHLGLVDLRAQVLRVTDEDAAASRAAPQPCIARAVPAPNVASTVASPTRIQVQFQPTAPALIRPETFKLLYGTFRIDITGRITAASKVIAEGIDVALASLPKGVHKLFIEVQDSAGRVGERVLQFEVA